MQRARGRARGSWEQGAMHGDFPCSHAIHMNCAGGVERTAKHTTIQAQLVRSDTIQGASRPGGCPIDWPTFDRRPRWRHFIRSRLIRLSNTTSNVGLDSPTPAEACHMGTFTRLQICCCCMPTQVSWVSGSQHCASRAPGLPGKYEVPCFVTLCPKNCLPKLRVKQATPSSF